MSISFVSFTPSSLQHSSFNPFAPKILLAILLTVCQTVLVMLGQRIWYWFKKYPLTDIFFNSYYTHFEIIGGPCNLIGSYWCDLFTNRTIFALNRIIFPANEEATLKKKQPIRFQGLFKVTNVISGKWKTKSNMWQILQPLFPKLLCFPPKKWMNLISN